MNGIEKLMMAAEAYVSELGMPGVSLILAFGLFLIITSVAVLLLQPSRSGVSRKKGGAGHLHSETAPGERHMSLPRKKKGDVFEQRIAKMTGK